MVLISGGDEPSLLGVIEVVVNAYGYFDLNSVEIAVVVKVLRSSI
jgi:hypothetical protein